MTNRHDFFVDEAGDFSLFDRTKEFVELGQNGVSKFFMVGIAKIPDIAKINKELEDLREDLLADPTLRNIPSIKKTQNYFHAKDDHQVVRREVFNLLKTNPVEIYVAIKNKAVLQQEARINFQKTGKKICIENVYQDLVKRLFRNLLHKSDENHIIFSARGKKDINTSMKNAINSARSNFEKKWKIKTHDNNYIQSSSPKGIIGLQIIDYYLWALQRLYERHEDYYFNKISNHYKMIMDLDDKRNKPYGEWYSKNNLLNLEKLKERRLGSLEHPA